MPAPNIVLLMADQQKATSLGLYGNPDVSTPALDALAARGLLAQDYFVQHPLCFPSRATIMTGLYPHTHGVFSNSGPMPANEPVLARSGRNIPGIQVRSASTLGTYEVLVAEALLLTRHAVDALAAVHGDAARGSDGEAGEPERE